VTNRCKTRAKMTFGESTLCLVDPSQMHPPF